MATLTDGTPVLSNGKYYVDPVNPMVKIKYVEPWYPPGVTEYLSGGNTACLGLLSDGNVLKYVRDREDRHALHSLNVEHSILSALGQHKRIVNYMTKTEHATISPQLCQKWTTQAAEALEFIHSKRVIHCDFHPKNLLLDDELNAQLCDFAGSTFGSLDGGAMESTRFYLPRDWRSPPNTKSDLFAFGSVMYYIMTGCEPYADLPDEEVATRFEQGMFPDVEGWKFGSTIKGCWTGEFETSRDMLDAILADVRIAL